MKLRAIIQIGHYPNMNAIASHLASDNPAIKTLQYKLQPSAVTVDSLTAIPALHNPKPCIVVYSYTALSSDCISL